MVELKETFSSRKIQKVDQDNIHTDKLNQQFYELRNAVGM